MLKINHNFKRHALLVILIPVSFIIFIAGFNYIVDPFQIYRKQSFVQPRFYSDQRFQNAGKINSYLGSDQYETVIIGHSHSDNFIPSKVQEFLNSGKVLKLTMDGSSPREQYLMALKALEKGKINTVLWGLGQNFYGNNPFEFNKRRFFPDYLYTESIFDDFSYLLSTDILNFSWALLIGRSKWNKDLETLNYWMPAQVDNYVKFSSEKNLTGLQEKLEQSNVKRLKEIPEIQKIHLPNIETNLLPLIEKYQHVNFILFFPPVYYLRLVDYNKYLEQLTLQKTIVEATAGFSNVRIFGFVDNSTIGGNAANYRDFGHYHSGVNMYILESIRDNRHRLTPLNFKEYESNIRANVLGFKIYSNFETMIPMALPQENDTLFAALRSTDFKDLVDNATALYKNKNYSEAIVKFNNIINIIPKDNATLLQTVYYYRGRSFLNMKDFQAAINDFNTALEINPDFAIAYIYIERGDAFLRLNNEIDAAKDFERFIALKPDHFRGYWMLGKISAKQGDFGQAIHLLTKAIELNSKEAVLYRDRADIYKKMGNFSLSESDIKKSRHLKL